MLTYGFYNSVAGDRVYDAEQLSSIFEGMIHDGVFEDIEDKLVVEASTGMNVKVGTGRAWFNQTWTKNDSDITLAVDAAEVVLQRIDVVVLEVDASVETRANSIKIVKGTPGSSPVAPTLTNTENVHQYPLAHILVEAGVTSIAANKITNKVGTVDCPYVTGVLRNIDTVAVDAILATFLDLEQEVEDNRTYYDANIGQTVNKTSIITTTGSANAYVGTYQSYVPISYDGMIAVIKASFSNTGAATINVQTIGVKTIKKMGPGGLVDLATGDIISGGIYTLFYDGTYFILGNPLALYASMFTAAGDIMVASGQNTPARLALTANALLKSNGANVGWLPFDATANKAVMSNGSDIIFGYPDEAYYAASSNVLLTANTERSASSNQTWVSMSKEFRSKRAGQVNINGEFKYEAAGGYLASLQFVDGGGVQIGSQVATSSSTYVPFSSTVDIDAPMDRVEIRGYSSGGSGTIYVRNVTMCATDTPYTNAIIHD